MISSLTELVLGLWSQYEREIWYLGAASAAMLVISAFLIPYLIVRLPADFYAEDPRTHRRMLARHPATRFAFLAVKNIVGLVLLLAGIAMLALPGQGILTILAALALLDFPGKRKLELAILKRPAILRAVNWLRERRGREPLRFADEHPLRDRASEAGQ